MKLESSNVSPVVKNVRGRVLLAALALIGSSSVLLLSGCSSAFKSGLPTATGDVVVAGLKGKVHGGQQPVSNATVQIYEVAIGTPAGYGAASTAVPVSTTTNSSGDWSYPTYTCASPSDELYVVARGGNPLGAGNSGTNNTALELTAAIGQCSNLGNLPFVVVNEVTTVATAYSLAGFMTTDTLHVGTSATNTVGLTNAFATFNNLVDLSTGLARTCPDSTHTAAQADPPPGYTAPPSGTSPNTFNCVVPYDAINTLADILASCVNSDGTTACTGASGLFPLVTTDVSNPPTLTNTADAALYIAHHPGLLQSNPAVNNIGAVFPLATPQSPFQPVLAAAPNDFTLTLNFIGGGLGGVRASSRSGAVNIAIDPNGNVWLPNSDRVSVTELSNLGAPLSPSTTTNTTSPYAPTSLGGWEAGTTGFFGRPEQIQFDQNGNAWISDLDNCLLSLTPNAVPTLPPTTAGPFTSVCPSGDTSAAGVSVDASNQVWVAGTTFISAASTAGTLASGFPITTNGSFVDLNGFLGADYKGNTWYVDEGTNHFGAYTDGGTLDTVSASGDLSGVGSYAAFGPLTSSGTNGGLELLIVEPGNQDIQPVNVTGNINSYPAVLNAESEAGPTGVAADGNAAFYLTNTGNGTTPPPNITVFAQNGSVASPPANGYTGATTLTSLNSPTGIAIDQSGNVWVVNANNGNPTVPGSLPISAGDSTVTEFVGLGAPVQPVLSLAAKAGAAGATNGPYGTKP